jgi:hypothetical protein
MQCFFSWQIFAEFRPEKYDFDLFTGFFMEKIIQIRQILTTSFFFKSPDFYHKFPPVGSQDYRRILLFFLLSCLVCSQIWLNCFLNDRHFGYIKKSIKETLIM